MSDHTFTSQKTIRFASFNITCDFFDKTDPKFQNHNWAQRRKSVLETIKQKNADIMGIQELSPTQALELSELPGYKSFFLCQTPSEVESGLFVEGKNVKAWIGKNVGTALVGIFYKDKDFAFLDKGRFWLKEDPDSLPVYTDRALTNKGFGNMNTYRATMWTQLKHLELNKQIFVFNSHYPLSGNQDTRFNCAKVERKKIDELAKGEFWISMGDRNIIPDTTSKIIGKEALEPLLQNAYDALIVKNHSGPLGTWAGFTYDQYPSPIIEGKFVIPEVLDVIASNYPSLCSEHVVTQFNSTTGEIQLNP